MVTENLTDSFIVLGGVLKGGKLSKRFPKAFARNIAFKSNKSN